MKRVAVFHNNDSALSCDGVSRDALAVQGVEYAVRGVETALRELGYEPIIVPAPEDASEFLDALARSRADVVINLVESLKGETRFEAAAAALYELAGVLYTGSPPSALSLALDKPRTQALLRGQGIPVPKGHCAASEREASSSDLHFPLIVKPSREDASHGLRLSSVVRNEEELKREVRRIVAEYAQPALIEEFYEGREFTVAILEQGATARVLPIREIDYTGFPEGAPRIVTYDAKWVEESQEFTGTTPRMAVDLSEALRKRIEAAALATFEAVGLRDYGRIDLRLDHNGEPLVLDVNANPDLSPSCGMAAAAACAGISYSTLIREILNAADSRRSKPSGNKQRLNGHVIPSEGELRGIRIEDRAGIERILQKTGVFTEEEVRVALELVDEGFLPEQTDYHFIVLELPPQGVAGYACFGPTPLTEGVYDLYWIAVDPDLQGKGFGARLYEAAHAAMRARGGRKLLIETASKPEYAKTRRFYDRIGLLEIARVKDFYRVGDDKIVYARPG